MSRWNVNTLTAWFDSHIIDYPTAINLNYTWSFGSAAGFCLAIQILSGTFLAIHYTGEINYAFSSVEYIIRDVNNGWLIRYLHANGASFFFIVVYCHLFRGLYYGSFNEPRQFLWWSGIVIFLLMIATAFLGYVLPWGQISFWGVTVITNLFSIIPVYSGTFVIWLWGGYTVGNPTLNRFYSLHYILPFVIAGLVFVHLGLLHKDGSNNPIGIKNKLANLDFYPYFYVKDLVGFFCFTCFFYLFFTFYIPNYLGHPDNYIPADSIKTPLHIVPEWYFLPFYAVLKAIPHKTGGILAIGGAIFIFFLIPFLNRPGIRSGNFRPIYEFFFCVFAGNFFILIWSGACPSNDEFFELCNRILTAFYFLFFYISNYTSGIWEKDFNRILLKK
uniref:apocytochrome B n=1 Tax=Choristocarpus tenellus TaxID=116065 RepID=UPI002E78DC9E|nr:apocytochrome B [Choristocarpus tenellus]WBP69823.1 apocytochrome B [Choristocarpus tenellus]